MSDVSVIGDHQTFRSYCNHVWYKCSVSSEIRFGHHSLWRQFSENSFAFLYFIFYLASVRVKLIYTRQNKTQTIWCFSVFLFYIRQCLILNQCGSSLEPNKYRLSHLSQMMSCWISVHACTNCTYSQFFYAAIKIYLDHIIILSVKYLPLRVIHPLCTACARSLNRKAKEHFRTLVGFLLRELDHCSSQMTLKKKTS